MHAMGCIAKWHATPVLTLWLHPGYKFAMAEMRVVRALPAQETCHGCPYLCSHVGPHSCFASALPEALSSPAAAYLSWLATGLPGLVISRACSMSCSMGTLANRTCRQPDRICDASHWAVHADAAAPDAQLQPEADPRPGAAQGGQGSDFAACRRPAGHAAQAQQRTLKPLNARAVIYKHQLGCPGTGAAQGGQSAHPAICRRPAVHTAQVQQRTKEPVDIPASENKSSSNFKGGHSAHPANCRWPTAEAAQA